MLIFLLCLDVLEPVKHWNAAVDYVNCVSMGDNFKKV